MHPARPRPHLALSFALLATSGCASSTSERAAVTASYAPSSEPKTAGATPASTSDAATIADASSAAQTSSATAPATRARDPEDEFPRSDAEPQNVAVTARFPEPTRPDPLHGQFTLDRATAGLPPGNTLVADIETTHGTFTCSLLPNEAPVTVANFVGLARGVRDFWDPVAGRWTRRAYYDGSVFHRVIPGFMIQGGDILRMGRGGPGYTIRDENVGHHDSAGLLCMANRGPNTGGSQFFVTEVPLPRLNGSYSVFGRCTPVDLVARIARLPRSRRDVPLTPVYIQHVTVHR